jgi:putative restriction endonuclease
MERRLWTREELILALSVYFQLPFGRLNRTTPEVKELAKLINRSTNSVALRLVNFAACDPVIIESGRTGMTGGLSTCLPIWNEYSNQKDKLFFEAQQIKAKKHNNTVENELNITEQELQGVDRLAYVKQRVNQQAFRSMILNIYERRCAITGINISDMLVASHIIPWAENQKERLNPENGLCLSALYDKSFDKGYISIDNNYRVLISEKLKQYHNEPFYAKHFAAIEGMEIHLPEYHKPNKVFLEWHRDMVFDKQ